MIFLSMLLILLLIAADQIIKYICIAFLKPVSSVEVIKGFIDFTYVENRGASFGILQDQRWILIAVTVVLCFIALYLLFYYKNHSFWSKAAGILIVAGGIGNLIDRIKFGYVVDFISISFFPPVFNFADCCIVIGTAALVIHILFVKEPQKKGHADEQNSSDNGIS